MPTSSVPRPRSKTSSVRLGQRETMRMKARRELEDSCQVLSTHFTLVQDLAEQPRPEGLSRVNGNDGLAAIEMPEEMMAPSNADYLETEPRECGDQLLPRQSRELRGHA